MSLPGGSARFNPHGRRHGSLAVGDGDAFDRIRKVTVAVNPASIGATTRGAIAVTVAGVAAGDTVIATPPAALEDDLIFAGARVTDDDEVTLYIYNPTAGAVDGAAANWDLTLIEFA